MPRRLEEVTRYSRLLIMIEVETMTCWGDTRMIHRCVQAMFKQSPYVLAQQDYLFMNHTAKYSMNDSKLATCNRGTLASPRSPTPGRRP